MVRRRAQLVYGYTERAFAERSKSHLTNDSNARRSTVKAAVFDANPSFATFGRQER